MFFNWKCGFDVYNTSKILFQTQWRNTNANMFNSMNYKNRFKYIDENTGELVTNLEALRTLNQNATIWSPFSTVSNVVIFTSANVEDGSYLRTRLEQDTLKTIATSTGGNYVRASDERSDSGHGFVVGSTGRIGKYDARPQHHDYRCRSPIRTKPARWGYTERRRQFCRDAVP